MMIQKINMKDKMQHIGSLVKVHLNGLMVECKIIDYKNSWGKDRWEITPMKGSGAIFMELSEDKFYKEEVIA